MVGKVTNQKTVQFFYKNKLLTLMFSNDGKTFNHEIHRRVRRTFGVGAVT